MIMMEQKNEYKDLKFAVYARKSQKDDGAQILSIPSQLETNEELALKYGIMPMVVFQDSETAHVPYMREGFKKLMEAIHAGEIDSLIVWKADRLARNPIEGGQVLFLLQTGLLKVIITPYNRYLPTDNTLPLTIEFGMANQYSIDLSRNVKRGNKTKIGQGGWCSLAPQGYLNEKVEKTVIVDPDRFDIVRKMWDLMLTGSYSLSQICEKANEWGFRTVQRKKSGGNKLAKSTLECIFKSPFYYGWMKGGENSNFGFHKPMVTQGEFERVQELLRRSGRKADTSCEFPLTGHIKCAECGCYVTAEEKVKYRCPECNKVHTGKNPQACKCGHEISLNDVGKGTWYTYYHCTKRKGKCGQKCVTGEKLEEQVDIKLSSLEIDPDFEVWALKWCKAMNEERFKTKEVENARFKRTYDQTELKIKRLIDMRADGELSKEEFLTQKEQAVKERDSAKENLKKAEGADNRWIQKVEEELDFAIGIRKRFKEGAIKDKKYIFSRVGSNFLLKDGILSLEAKRLYVAFKELANIADVTLEPTKNASESGLSLFAEPPYINWLPRSDSNRRPTR